MVSQQRRGIRREPTTPRLDKGTPARTCVGCRERFAPAKLLRLVLDPDGVTPRLDYLGKLPGRGAYVCPNLRCMTLAVEKGGLKRTFRQPVVASADALMQEAFLASRRQILALIALARRASHAVAGTSRVEHCLRQGEGILMLLARDASGGVQQKFRQWARRVGLAVHNTLSKAELGTATGLPESSIIVIVDPGFAQKIEQEVQRAGHLIPLVEEP